MFNFSNITAGLVAGAVITSVVPALGASRIVPPGYNARAQAIEESADGGHSVSAHRAAALRECAERGDKLLQKDWGVRSLEVEAACMAEHGEIQ